MDHGIDNTILIASGKGGVGKSTVAVNLALALAKAGYATGLLDADVHGPSVATMLEAGGLRAPPEGGGIEPFVKYGVKVMSMGYLVGSDSAMIWRGPMMAGAVLQLVSEVAWGELDYLIFDLPPGTGDVPLSIAQKVEVTGAVLVTTPQTVAIADVVRAKTMFDRVEIPTLGLIENMSHYVCPTCHERQEIFSSGGGERLAEELDLPLLGSIPLDSEIRAGGDTGRPVVEWAPQSESAGTFVAIARRLDKEIRARQSAQQAVACRRRRLKVIQ